MSGLVLENYPFEDVQFFEIILTNSQNARVLDELLRVCDNRDAPGYVQRFWNFLMTCFETPRPSSTYDGTYTTQRQDLIREMVKKVAQHYEWVYNEDEHGNVVVRTKPTGMHSMKIPVVCLQAHLDVVCSKNEGVVHNFDVDPIEVQLIEDTNPNKIWIQALKRTTLGADNGVGIAAGLSILEYFSTGSFKVSGIPHLELLLTADEEEGFIGAEKINPGMILSDNLLNLDSEEEKKVCVGSAGGFMHSFDLPVNLNPDHGMKHSIEIHISGLLGGHTGVDLHRQRGNAIQCMGRILLGILECKPKLSFLKGGTAINSIPRECKAIVWFGSQEDAKNAEEIIDQQFLLLKSELDEADNPILLLKALLCFEEVSQLTTPNSGYTPMLSCEETVRVVHLLNLVPHGIYRRCRITHSLESSSCLTLTELKEDCVCASLLARSVVNGWMRYYSQQLCAFGNIIGAHNKPLSGYFDAWEPTTENDNQLLYEVQQAHLRMFGEKAHAYTVHAGLECGSLLRKKPSLMIASIGPTITGAHSPDEKLSVQSARDFMIWLKEIVETLVGKV